MYNKPADWIFSTVKTILSCDTSVSEVLCVCLRHQGIAKRGFLRKLPEPHVS